MRIRFIMNFICEVTGRYADDYYIVFSMLCRTFIMYVIRRGRTLCARQHVAGDEMKYGTRPAMRDDDKHRPLQIGF